MSTGRVSADPPAKNIGCDAKDHARPRKYMEQNTFSKCGVQVELGAVQHALELLDERLPLRRVGPAQQLLGFLPRQLAAVQSSPDRLATAHSAEALAGPADQAAQRPARGWIRPFYGAGGRRALGRADHLAEFGCAARAKKGRRPPVRRNASAAGPPWL